MQNETQTPKSVLGILHGHTLADLPADSRLTPMQTAEILNVSKDTLQIWRSTGRHNLPYIKVGGRVNYRAGDLRDWLARRTKTHTGEVAA